MESERQNEIRNEIKAYIARSGWTMTDIVKEMNKTRPEDQQTTTQNITNKLARGTIKIQRGFGNCENHLV